MSESSIFIKGKIKVTKGRAANVNLSPNATVFLFDAGEKKWNLYEIQFPFQKLDKILKSYERVAESEKFLLLSFSYPLTQDD